MRLLLLSSILFLSFSAKAQTYAKYTGNAANKTSRDTVRAKPVAAPEKPVAEITPVKTTEKPRGNFQDLMNKAVEQFKGKNYNGAVSLYTQALDVSMPEEAWRALTSRATLYAQMNRKDKAIEDYTKIIETNIIPEKKLAYTYLLRARMEAETNKTDLACNDLKIAKEMGVPEMLLFELKCD